jgi:hypothetical protein
VLARGRWAGGQISGRIGRRIFTGKKSVCDCRWVTVGDSGKLGGVRQLRGKGVDIVVVLGKSEYVLMYRFIERVESPFTHCRLEMSVFVVRIYLLGCRRDKA